MEQLQTLIHGEPNWDTKVNDLIDKFNEEVKNERLVILQDWTSDGVVLENGFNLPDDSDAGRISWRTIGHSNGEVLFTDVSGVVITNNWKGGNTEFAKIGGAPIPPRQIPIGGSIVPYVNDANTGYAQITLGVSGNTTTMYMNGYRENNGNIDGWLRFRILY